MPSPRDLSAVRSEVRQLLEKSPAFLALGQEEKRALANSMVRVGHFLADPGWLERAPNGLAQAQAGAAPGPNGASEEKADPIQSLKERLAEKPGMVGKEFEAGAVRQGVEQFGAMVGKVDFPAFVSGLVNGVFKAVVNASIDQMKAYGELLSAVSKTVDQFAKDNITDAMARDHVRNRYPSMVVVDTSGEGARLRPAPGADEPDGALAKDFRLKNLDLGDDDSEQSLVNAAKLEMAQSRQQLLATMVLLGINRIVVTDGRINAKVVFDMRADDEAFRKAHAQLDDEARSSSSSAAFAGAIMPWGGGGGAFTSTNSSHVATVSSAIDDTSEARAQVKAQLSGDVQLRFKSETFPLERMVDSNGLAMLNQRAQPGAAPAAPGAPATPGTGAK
jgi:hypothetical protein